MAREPDVFKGWLSGAISATAFVDSLGHHWLMMIWETALAILLYASACGSWGSSKLR